MTMANADHWEFYCPKGVDLTDHYCIKWVIVTITKINKNKPFSPI